MTRACCLRLSRLAGLTGKPAAGGNHGAGTGGQFRDELVFEFAKGRLAVLRKNLRDAFAGARFDEFVGVEEFKAQLFRHQPADGGLARAHEPNQGQIDNVAGSGHAEELNGFGRG